MRAAVVRPLLLVLVLVTSAPDALAETREVHQTGPCNLSDYLWPKKTLQATATAAMSYKVQLSSGPFARDEWAIYAPLFIANGTDKLLHLHYYIAFFDSADRLVGCCSQGTEARPGIKDLQLGSCIIQGPKQRLLTTAKYQFTIYESDRPIGEEPISVKDAVALPGRSGAVTTLLTGVVLKKDTKDDLTVLHLSADCSFQESDNRTKNTHLEIEGARLLDVYLSTEERQSRLVRNPPGEKTETILRRWMIDANREVKRQAQGVRGVEHLALLDRKGHLVVCGPVVGLSARDLVAPKDRLLSASTLQMVIYESIAAAGKKR